MTPSKQPLTSVPTNIITGFLGVGKTSAILNLLKYKAGDERWAVLVNEFGEIGVDGSILEGQHSENQGVFIAEVPGGCMCCATGLPMQIALNELLKRARPDRLLIEPTGLGHPKEVLQVLSEDHYQGVLDIQKTITLVDARKLTDSRYTEHETFNQQIAIADIVIGNKSDLYQEGNDIQLRDYVASKAEPSTEVMFSSYGAMEPALLKGATRSTIVHPAHHHHHADSKPLASEQAFPDSGIIKAINNGEGYVSVGWRLTPKKVFDYHKVRDFVLNTEAERLKAVFITNKGIFSFNKSSDGLQEMALDEYAESRVEIIALEESAKWGEDLFACLIGDSSNS
jgi:G3E family GTPase